MILPSALIAGFLLLGFQREFNPTLELKYTNSLLGNSTASTYKSDDLSGIISSLSSINGVDGYSSKAMSNMTSMGNKYISDITKDPSLENVFKNLVNFGADEDAANDPELKEIQDIIKSIMKEDLKIETPFDVITFGLKMMASQAAGSE
jgi:pantoate kinase